MSGHALVTGGAGFIGGHLAHRLVQDGWQVTVLDDFSSGREANLAGIAGRHRLVRGSVADADLVRRAAEGCGCIFHLAACASVTRTIEDPVGSHRVNVDGTLAVLEAARATGACRVVFSSSAAVYGDGPPDTKHENLATDPISPYAAHKAAGESLCKAYHRAYGVQAACLRYFNVFGPRQDPHSDYAAVIPKFVTALLEGHRPTVFGDGEQSRDFVYVADVVEANLRAAAVPAAAGRVFNVAVGESISLNRLLATLGEVLDVKPDPVYAPPRPGDIKHSAASAARALEVLDFRPSVPLAEGLARTIAWYREPA